MFSTGITSSLECKTTYPAFASNVLLELYFDPSDNSSDPYVKILYDGNYM